MSDRGTGPIRIVAAAWHATLYGAIVALCVYVTVVHVIHLQVNPWFVSPLWLLGAAVTWVHPVLAIAGLVSVVPLVNGATLVWSQPAGNPWNVVFAGIALAWIVRRRLVDGRSLAPVSRPAIAADLLSTVGLISLAVLLLRYPASEIYPAVFRELTLSQFVVLYGVQASAVLVQGLVLFRMVEFEGQRLNARSVASVFALVAGAVIVFSLVQVAFDAPEWRGLVGKGRRGLFSPFDDIHSYGSATVLVWPVVVFLALGARNRWRWLLGAAAVVLAGCAVMSLSRTTWVAFAAAVALSAWQLRRRQVAAAAAAAIVVGAAAVGAMYARNVPIPFLALSTQQLASPAVLGQRLYQWRVASSMIADEPLSGTGIGSFLRLFPYYSDYDPIVDANPYSVRAPANAHNYYLQLAAELGVPALVLFGAIFWWVFAAVRRRSPDGLDGDLALQLVKGLSVGVGAYLVSCVSGHPLLLPSQQFLFWFAVGSLVVLTRANEVDQRRLPRSARAAVALLILAAAAGHVHRACALPTSRGMEFGVYPADRWEDERIRWTSGVARLPLKPTSDVLVIRLIADSSNIGPRGLGLGVSVNDVELEQATIVDPGGHYLYYYVPGLSASTAPALGLSVSRTFNPRRLGLSGDYRDLGVAIAAIGYLAALPPGGIGFHAWDLPEAAGPPLPAGVVSQRFRWTRRQATLPVDELSPDDGAKLMLASRHPDVATTPVFVDVLADGRRLRTVPLTDARWTRIVLTPEQLRGVHGLTLRVDRTWNPRASRVGDDPRDLGIAVIVE